MKLFVSLGLVLTLSCSLSKAQGSKEVDITDFVSKMWELDVNRIGENQNLYTLDLQGSTSSATPRDNASFSLFQSFNENVIYSQDTYETFIPLCDNYDPLKGVPEDNTLVEQSEVSTYLEDIMGTTLMEEALRQFEVDGYVAGREDFLEKLETAFFALHEHVDEHGHSIYPDNVYDSCGFELTFCGELENTGSVHGLHNWITFYDREKDSLNYFGYLDSTSVRDSCQLLEVQFSWSGSIMPSSPMFVGVSTEFELAVYMACFFRQPLDEKCSFKIDDISMDVHIHTTVSGSHISEAYMHESGSHGVHHL
ncbi:Poly(U)-specific endoribonuclease [Holothuria leucospilota]|uniref:Uridylate-specific endoribonuclease n=1 Tax=Holothuria leucospilota TaxID=206669 RepID=A0A9Q1CHM2_HOLLE|nr:Poly(U)-specific endoribonuclease [Holothuria leucospilota]